MNFLQGRQCASAKPVPLKDLELLSEPPDFQALDYDILSVRSTLFLLKIKNMVFNNNQRII